MEDWRPRDVLVEVADERVLEVDVGRPREVLVDVLIVEDRVLEREEVVDVLERLLVDRLLEREELVEVDDE